MIPTIIPLENGIGKCLAVADIKQTPFESIAALLHIGDKQAKHLKRKADALDGGYLCLDLTSTENAYSKRLTHLNEMPINGFSGKDLAEKGIYFLYIAKEFFMLVDAALQPNLCRNAGNKAISESFALFSHSSTGVNLILPNWVVIDFFLPCLNVVVDNGGLKGINVKGSGFVENFFDSGVDAYTGIATDKSGSTFLSFVDLLNLFRYMGKVASTIACGDTTLLDAYKPTPSPIPLHFSPQDFLFSTVKERQLFSLMSNNNQADYIDFKFATDSARPYLDKVTESFLTLSIQTGGDAIGLTSRDKDFLKANGFDHLKKGFVCMCFPLNGHQVEASIYTGLHFSYYHVFVTCQEKL